jgi:type I restriction enzyme, S subunit
MEASRTVGMNTVQIMRLPAVRGFKSYAAYKDSAVESLSEIPSDWEIMKVTWLFSIGSGTTPPSGDPTYYGGSIPWVTTSELRESVITSTDKTVTERALQHFPSLRVHPAGSVAVAMYGATIGRLGILGVPAAVNQACCVFSNPKGIDKWFWFYWLQMRRSHLISLGYGGGQPNLSQELLRSIRVPLPSVLEQRAIVAFLDRETAKIDTLIGKNERLIELLEEERTSLVTRVITKGLDPMAPTKNVGVEWLGEIPAHWEVKRLWHLTPSGRRIMYGIVLPGPNVDDGVPIVKGGDVSSDRLRLDLLNRTAFEIESSYVRSRLRSGDLVYAIRGSIGEVAIVPDALEGANLTQDAARVAYNSETHGPWLLYALKSAAIFAQLESGALGATIRGINIRDLKRASIPVPPRVEQLTIAVVLDRETARIDALTAEVGEAINRLKELRAALISAAVTGKIDVRGAFAEASASQEGAA